MKLIKLNAINSTNTFLKDLSKNTILENFTIVVTENQTNGRGQQESSWVSEPNKNLTFSVYLCDLNLDISNKKYLNYAVSLSIFSVLKNKNIPNLAIKWPNDIVSGNKKLCGILIENSIQKNSIQNSIIGIGLNVNQERFSETLKNVTSLKNLLHKDVELDNLLKDICFELQNQLLILSEKKYQMLEDNYLKVLYQIHKAMMFKNTENELFLGIIRGISETGNIIIELENETKREFGIKEISFA
ncbi:biotin--[acetyl-CoA-carboxylase] ligase [Polaribacter gangjinensis]|uniref:Biotin--[acetyl-CoA-carboxylase] ligase n=1 Tax=Polaribacter gangjinensis TaxID=574710 RepID=A0A2S7W9F9_9FLAO|nr:biotin--[acetyl-CoA-carboxylase] ligase [Polaribacter gangjinensis]PQJ73852.1 biotin--[acetyl-CoA-carboxylase] ligase [Polaribacter gangjinensis]